MKNNNWEAEFIQLEQTIGEELRQLPTIDPDEEFKEQLKQKIYAQMPQTSTRRLKKKTRKPWPLFKVGVLAASLLLALVVVKFSLVSQSGPSTASIGPFLIPTVQASPGGSHSFLSSAGLDQVRQVELWFKVHCRLYLIRLRL